jgi:hypothetical protein
LLAERLVTKPSHITTMAANRNCPQAARENDRNNPATTGSSKSPPPSACERRPVSMR